MVDKDEVRRLRDLGLTLRHIGQAVGCSHERVRQILEDEEQTDKRMARQYQLRRQKDLLKILKARKQLGWDLTEHMTERIQREVGLEPAFAQKVDDILKGAHGLSH